MDKKIKEGMKAGIRLYDKVIQDIFISYCEKVKEIALKKIDDLPEENLYIVKK